MQRSLSGFATLRAKVGGALHFRPYMGKDKSFIEDLLAAALEADIDVMYLTVDTSVTSVREKDVRNGFRAVT